MNKWLVSLAMLLLSTMALANDWPTRPVELVVGNAPGGTSDIVGRALARSMSKTLGQPVVVVNKPGAGGVLGFREVIRSAPDGYTLGLATAVTTAVAPLCVDPLPYDPVRDAVYLGSFMNIPNGFAVSAQFPANNFQDFVKQVKANPGKYNVGAQSCVHHQFVIEYVKNKHSLDIVTIPYKSTVQVLTAAVGNQIQIVSDTLGTMQPHLQAGNLKLLAVSWKRRLPEHAGTPTWIELGIPENTITNWYGLMVPPNIPTNISRKLAAAVKDASQDPEVIALAKTLGGDIEYQTGPELTQEIGSTFTRHRNAIASGKVKLF